MKEKPSQVNWGEILLQPQKDWYRKSCPVVELIVVRKSTGEIVEQKLARISPVSEGTIKLDYELDYAISEEGVHKTTSGVEMDVLEAGGWHDELSGLSHYLQFAGYTTDKKFKNTKWSYTF